MQTNARLVFQILVALAVVFGAFLCFLFFDSGSHISIRGVQTKNLSNAKQLGMACRLYAMDHQGRFPAHLSELEPDYVAPGVLNELRCVSMGKDGDPKYMMDWLYFGAGFDDSNRPQVLIASPQATTNGKTQKREVIHGDISGTVIEEAPYQQMLAETVNQMRALDDARHPPKPAAATPPKQETPPK